MQPVDVKNTNSNPFINYFLFTGPSCVHIDIETFFGKGIMIIQNIPVEPMLQKVRLQFLKKSIFKNNIELIAFLFLLFVKLERHEWR